jgi:hypothetical protein
MATSSNGFSAHRANYTLARGKWLATCKECGFTVQDVARRRAAALFRLHIKEAARDPATRFGPHGQLHAAEIEATTIGTSKSAAG